MDNQVVNWSYSLQLMLEKLSDEEFAKYMEGKVIKMDGKLYGLVKEEVQ